MSKNSDKPKRNKPKILTKYDQFVVPRLRDIPVWVREGATDEEIAKRLNIHIWTLGDYRRKHPKFAEALERPTQVGNTCISSVSGNPGMVRRRRECRGHYQETRHR